MMLCIVPIFNSILFVTFAVYFVMGYLHHPVLLPFFQESFVLMSLSVKLLMTAGGSMTGQRGDWAR